MTGAMSLTLGLLILLILRSRAVLWGPVAAAACAFFISAAVPQTRRLIAEARGRAVLLGATIASYAGVYWFFVR